MLLILEDLNLGAAERRMCLDALHAAGSIQGAAVLLRITRHALARRLGKLEIDWPPSTPSASHECPPERPPTRAFRVVPRLQVTSALSQERLDRFCETLPDRERALFRSRILGVERPLSLRDFGKRWGLSAEGVRKLELRLFLSLGTFALHELGSDNDTTT